MARDTLHFSPLLPLQPDWQALAQECSRAYFALCRVTAAVREGKADGRDFWQAQNRMDKAASVIAAWGDPELYGRLLAREQILATLEAATPFSQRCQPCDELRHTSCLLGACQCLHRKALADQRKSLYESQPPPTCANVANNTPHASCCEQCRYELGI